MKENLLLKLDEVLLGVDNIGESIGCIKLNGNTIKNLPKIKINDESDKRNYGYVKIFDAIPVLQDDLLGDNEIKIEFKSDKDKLIHEINDMESKIRKKERFNLEMCEALELYKVLYKTKNETNLYEKCRLELENRHEYNLFLNELVIGIEKIKRILDEM